jgi:ADP-ribose pyrophosphatase YjhB (NUDIX family)
MAHIHEKYDFVISVYIVFGDKVLLVNHPRYNMWVPMGGHIELDEDPEQAIFREIKEETGLEVEILSDKPTISSPGTKFIFTPNFVDVHVANPPHKHIALTYFARATTNKHVLSDEHSDINWLSEADLEKPEYNLSEAVKFYSRAAIKSTQNR